MHKLENAVSDYPCPVCNKEKPSIIARGTTLMYTFPDGDHVHDGNTITESAKCTCGGKVYV